MRFWHELRNDPLSAGACAGDRRSHDGMPPGGILILSRKQRYFVSDLRRCYAHRGRFDVQSDQTEENSLLCQGRICHDFLKLDPVVCDRLSAVLSERGDPLFYRCMV